VGEKWKMIKIGCKYTQVVITALVCDQRILLQWHTCGYGTFNRSIGSDLVPSITHWSIDWWQCDLTFCCLVYGTIDLKPHTYRGSLAHKRDICSHIRIHQLSSIPIICFTPNQQCNVPVGSSGSSITTSSAGVSWANWDRINSIIIRSSASPYILVSGIDLITSKLLL